MQFDSARPSLLTIVGVLKTVNDVLETCFKTLAGACLGTLVVVVFIDVLFRQVINDPLLWPSEIATLVFVWSVVCGAAVSVRRRAHFVVDVLPQKMSPNALTTVKLVVVGFGFLFAVVLCVYGFEMAVTGLKRFTPMKGYPMIYHFTAFPIGGAAIFIFTFEHLLEILTGTSPDERSYSTQEEAPEGDGE
jgi:TRAP-type transport system small permease protein